MTVALSRGEKEIPWLSESLECNRRILHNALTTENNNRSGKMIGK